ncbi:cytochrome P450 4V2-like [Asterias amurensis]|uniref:cytochrome P450 4V2-like n=1 Tax=Asterias amurensis TaxID=7602 RepID=UPI003AB708CF
MSILIPVFLTAAAVFTVYYVLIHLVYGPWKRFQYFNKEIPGPPALPIVGNAHLFDRDPAKFYQQVLQFCRDYPKVFRIMLGPTCMIAIHNAKDAEVLFNSTKHITKSFVYDFLHPWLGAGLLTSKGSKWFHRRKLLTPTFHFSILNNFRVVFNEKADILARKLSTMADGRAFNIFPIITQCSLDIICETAMGKNIHAQENEKSEYVQSVIKMSELIQERQKYPWYWFDGLYSVLPSGKEHARCLKVLHDATSSVIKERNSKFSELYPRGIDEQSVEEPKKRRLAFLDLLLHMHRDDNSFTFEDIREEVDTFMFEGHDTTAAGASWCLYLLGRHPEIQQRVHEELDEVFGDNDEPATSDQLQSLLYLTRVLKETLRIYPSVPFIGRTLEEDCVIGGYKLPKGVNAIALITGLHRDPEVFPNPEEFDPDRFLPENCVNRHAYAYVPFSAGARNCIGQRFAMMEEKVMVSAVLRRFNIQSLQTPDEVLPLSELILRPSGGIQVKLTPRS